MRRTKFIALAGVMSALMFVILLLETYVFIAFIKPSPAFLSIPIAIALSVYGDKKTMFLGGTIFGFCSFILSFIVGYITFYNPLISILPRVLMGIIAYFACALTMRLTKNSNNKFLNAVLPYSVGGLFGVLANTCLVLLSMSIFSGDPFVDTAIAVILGLNFSLELICSVILVPILVAAIKKYNESNKSANGDINKDEE